MIGGIIAEVIKLAIVSIFASDNKTVLHKVVSNFHFALWIWLFSNLVEGFIAERGARWLNPLFQTNTQAVGGLKINEKEETAFALQTALKSFVWLHYDHIRMADRVIYMYIHTRFWGHTIPQNLS